MHLNLLLREPVQVWLHLFTVVPAFFLGTWLIFLSGKGSRYHRVLGKFYMVLMVVTAFAAIFVQELRPGHWSWIHLFVPLTFWGVWRALTAVRKGDIAAHKKAMLGLYIGGLVIAGSLTFFPGRLMYRMFIQ
jgi:uncharacterized membrane protein